MKKLRGASALIPACVLFSLALSVGCADGENEIIDIVFDPCEPLVLELQSSDVDEEARVAAAIEMWNQRAGSLLTLDEVEQAPVLPVVFDRAPKAFHGHYDDEAGVVYINRDLRGRQAAITVAHELGHAFGLYHVHKSVRPSVMNHGNLVHEVNEGDVDELVALWGACPSS